jgi:Ca2+-dependent lipid-binding protein
VLCGRNLAVKDITGTSDPYCVVTIEEQQFKTKTIKKNLDPVWDEEFRL